MINENGMGALVVLALLCMGTAIGQSDDALGVAVKSKVIVRPKSMTTDFWSAERMKAAKEPSFSASMENMPTSRSFPGAMGPQVTIPAVQPDAKFTAPRALKISGRLAATNGRAFWSCRPNVLSSCSASVVPSTSGDVIVTAAHCAYDTSESKWLADCNWIFVPGYSNGTAPYGRWPARQVAVLGRWLRKNPDYNYDVSFLALSPLNGKHIAQVTGTQGLGFNQLRSQATHTFGYPSNIAGGLLLQSCLGMPVAPPSTLNGYFGQGLPKCQMGTGCSGGPWLQRLNQTSGVGIVSGVNSFMLSSVPNTIYGPVFDSVTRLMWDQITAL